MPENQSHADLRTIARRAMIARGFLVDLPDDAQSQMAAQREPPFGALKLKDLSSWYWSSIDNDDSKDLDQIEYATREGDGIRIYVGVADVDWFVPLHSPLDRSAEHNTTSVYTGVTTFPMLPEGLSTDISSLNEGVARLAVVVEVLVTREGRISESSVYPAIVKSKAQLTYNAVAAWLETDSNPDYQSPPISPAGHRTLEKIRNSEELQTQLRLQDKAAAALRKLRHDEGALTLQTSELKPIISLEGNVVGLESKRQNRATLLIEDLMIAANQVTARFLDRKRLPNLRRIVKAPEKWDRIVALAATMGGNLPEEPDAKSLEVFLRAQRQKDPANFGDLSLAIIKLIGRGEYAAKGPEEDASGHFGLAVGAYSHSTAPNRRFPDLVTQRLLKAAISGAGSPYSSEELSHLAAHCTEREKAADKVERLVRKCAAAVLLQNRIGEEFDAVVTGVTSRGKWVRLTDPPVEGKLFGATGHLDVGHRVRVRLDSVDYENGFIDFEVS